MSDLRLIVSLVVFVVVLVAYVAGRIQARRMERRFEEEDRLRGWVVPVLLRSYGPARPTAIDADFVREVMRLTQGHPDNCGCTACCCAAAGFPEADIPPFADRPGDSPSF